MKNYRKMKTVFDKSTREELISRINLLNENNTAQWGKMNLSQMLKHCTVWEEWVSGDQQNKQVFIGRLFGKMALKMVLKDESPLKRNSPTSPEFRIKEITIDITSEKNKWISLIESYDHFSKQEFLHSFFGRMTKEQIGYLAYKHNDHHLRQFNA